MQGVKIAISGAQSTGKTTLIDLLFAEEMFHYTFALAQSPTRIVEEQGYKINEIGGDKTQLLICSKHIENYIENSREEDNVIFDRCALDGFVYTSYLYCHNKVEKSTLKLAESVFHSLINKYDIIFYIPPEIPLANDGVRSVNTAFRDEVVQIFDEYIKFYRLPVIEVSGNAAVRVEKIKQATRSIQEAKKKRYGSQ